MNHFLLTFNDNPRLSPQSTVSTISCTTQYAIPIVPLSEHNCGLPTCLEDHILLHFLYKSSRVLLRTVKIFAIQPPSYDNNSNLYIYIHSDSPVKLKKSVFLIKWNAKHLRSIWKVRCEVSRRTDVQMNNRWSGNTPHRF